MDKSANKPSASKLPVFRRRSPEPIYQRIAQPKRVLRRSKSVSDLKPHRLMKLPENAIPPFIKVPVRPALPLVIPAPKGKQRSNSTTEPELTKNAIRSKAVVQASSSKVTLGKRPAEVQKCVNIKVPKIAGNDQKENGKPVVPRQKIPPYDYKARYNALLEKHEKYKEAHKDCAEIKSSYGTLQIESVRMSERLEKLEPDFVEVSNDLRRYKNKYSIIKQKHEKITIDYEDIKMKYTSLYAEYSAVMQKHEASLLRIDDLETTVRQQSQRLEVCDRDRRILHNLVQELKGNIRVFCRVRPALLNEQQRIACDINYTSDKIEIRNPRTSNVSVKSNVLVQEFHYDAVFPPESKQFDVFEELDHLVQSALDGYHVCVFAYGQTGSGKTYTMQGEATEEGRGMIPRSVESLFHRISDLKLAGWSYVVEASFLEIYNEAVKDLLNPTSKLPYEIKYNEGKGVTIPNLEIKPISSKLELLKLIRVAEQNRSVAVTNYNEHSSRSHAITKINLRGTHQSGKIVLSGSLNLVDLAGSENAKRSTPDTILETKHINKSLATLSNVMLALHSKRSHVPYRDSKLTYLLESCLGGNSKTLMFVNICPFEDCYAESANALRFAAKVKEVKMNFKKNKTVS